MNLMKSLVVAVGVCLGTFQAFAGQVHLDENRNPTAFLPSCQGMASVARNFAGELVLKVDGISNCSILEVQGGHYHGQVETGAVLEEVYGHNTIVATVRSHTGAHSDMIMITSYPHHHEQPVHADVYLDSRHNRFAALNSCGGTVELKMVAGQADLVFHNVRECSNFDILESNGRPTAYPNKKMQGINGDRGGSFTLPEFILKFGSNGVLVTVKSDSGHHQDVIYVQFYEF